MKVWDWNQGADTCVRANLWIIAKKLQNNIFSYGQAEKEYQEVKEFCRLDKWTGHKKSSDYYIDKIRVTNAYTWDRSEDIRKYLQKIIPWTMYCGLNGDQYRAYFLNLAHDKDVVGALKVMFGFIYRAFPLFIILKFCFGFNLITASTTALLFSPFPSLMEFVIFKPHTFLMLFRAHWVFEPLFWLIYPFWLISKWRNLKIPISKDTSNKITLLIQMKMLGHKLPAFWYVRKIYKTYFTPGSDNEFIGEEVIEALIRDIGGFYEY